MFQIKLKNEKFFQCDEKSTIFEAAKNCGIILEHSCLNARCRSCAVQIIEGTTKDKLDDLVLSPEEKDNKWILCCNSIPTSDLIIDKEDIGDIEIYEKKIFPAKIESIYKLTENIIEVKLKLPPISNFRYNSGQYVNIIKGQIKRSYSIANSFQLNNSITFFIKKYDKGIMSNYWFNDAQVNDLLRIEGPLGSFFYRANNLENIIFLATGTGVAPIKAILENFREFSIEHENKNIWLFVGARYEKDLFWNPIDLIKSLKINYIPVLSRGLSDWEGERGYIQEIVIKKNISLTNAQVYACGSNEMLESAKKILVENGLHNNNFFSDAFVPSN
jgi:CDP-4-dehydro-6-deoxyglucose reductase